MSSRRVARNGSHCARRAALFKYRDKIYDVTEMLTHIDTITHFNVLKYIRMHQTQLTHKETGRACCNTTHDGYFAVIVFCILDHCTTIYCAINTGKA